MNSFFKSDPPARGKRMQQTSQRTSSLFFFQKKTSETLFPRRTQIKLNELAISLRYKYEFDSSQKIIFEGQLQSMRRKMKMIIKSRMNHEISLI